MPMIYYQLKQHFHIWKAIVGEYSGYALSEPFIKVWLDIFHVNLQIQFYETGIEEKFSDMLAKISNR